MDKEKVISKPMELPLEDGTGDLVDELEKQREEIRKEAEKELKDRAKVMDEVNSAKEVKAEFKDGSGKALKIKNMTEKLILDESDDALVENWLTEDGDFISDIYNALAGVAFKYRDTIERMSGAEIEEDFEEAFDWFITHFADQGYEEDLDESSCELKEDEEHDDYDNEWDTFVDKVYHAVYKLISELNLEYWESANYICMALKEAYHKLQNVIRDGRVGNGIIIDEIDEALPKDLAKTYKNRPFRIGSGNQNSGYGNIIRKSRNDVNPAEIGVSETPVEVDFQNSNYEKITPEEALKLKKEGKADLLRVIFDGQLVAFDSTGHPTYKATRRYNSDYDLYKKPKDGKIVQHTTLLPFKDVLTRAEAIYKADEKVADTDLQKKRAENPESMYYRGRNTDWSGSNGYYSSDSYNYIDNRYRGADIDRYDYHRNNRDKESAAEAEQYINRLEDRLAKYESELEGATTEREKDLLLTRIAETKSEIEYQQSRAKNYNDRVNKFKNDIKDYRAHRRYLASKHSLEGVIKDYKRLNHEFNIADRELASAHQKLDIIKTQGSPTVRRYKDDLSNAQERLKQIQLSIAKLELYLESADEDNQVEIDKASKFVDECEAKLREVTDKIVELKSRKKEDFEPEEGGEELEEAKLISTFDKYEPWSGAVDTYETIKNAGKLDELEAVIEELYPEGIDETQLNDILWFEDDWLYETLGISEGDNDEE